MGVEGGVLLRRVALDPIDPDPLSYASRLAQIPIRARAPTRIGARIGRPEKAHQRTMRPNVHALFPIGEAGGAKRSVSQAVRETVQGGVSVPLGVRQCPTCGRRTVWTQCTCGTHTEPTGAVLSQSFPVAQIWREAIEGLGLARTPEVKAVKGLTSPGKTPERIEKGILRAHHGISVYQDGTARFDLTDLPLTHFRPREIGTDIPTLRQLGYESDWTGAPLESVEQLVELAPQDVIVSRSCGEYLLHLAQFVDDELVHLYHAEPFYRATGIDAIRGAVVVALAPHTSGGVAGRIIGFTEAEACFAHPLFHAAKRRNCDGDEDSVTLLLDALLNFSRAFLPDSRGALMDKPLVLTTRLNATEVDKEAHNVDIGARYPLALYRAAMDHRSPREVEALFDTVGRRTRGGSTLSGYAFTHDTQDIAGGPVRSAYRDDLSMMEKVEQSFLLAAQIRAVDVGDAVTILLNGHFLLDMMGNLRAYATQSFRCKSCNTSYRRPPLSGRCSQPSGRNGRCDGTLAPTVFEASVRKYLALSQNLAKTSGVTPYVRQRIQVLADSLATLFPENTAQTRLEAF